MSVRKLKVQEGITIIGIIHAAGCAQRKVDALDRLGIAAPQVADPASNRRPGSCGSDANDRWLDVG